MATAANTVDLGEFARRVERLCEYLLDKVEHKDGSSDIRVIQDLKEDAADIHTDQRLLALYGDEPFVGLDDHMRGAR